MASPTGADFFFLYMQCACAVCICWLTQHVRIGQPDLVIPNWSWS